MICNICRNPYNKSHSLTPLGASPELLPIIRLASLVLGESCLLRWPNMTLVIILINPFNYFSVVNSISNHDNVVDKNIDCTLYHRQTYFIIIFFIHRNNNIRFFMIGKRCFTASHFGQLELLIPPFKFRRASVTTCISHWFDYLF